MEIKLFEQASQAAEYVANSLAKYLQGHQKANIGLATGRTMDAVYHHLAEINKQNKFHCEKIKFFALDEYIGLAKDDSQSYRAYLDLHVFNPLKIKKDSTFIPDVHHQDLDKAAYEYEALIKRHGGIELQILGIGVNGHIGLNEPGSAHDSRTRIVALSQQTMRSNRTLFKNREIPLTAMTMGIGTILEARKCILLATGQTKAEIVQRLVNGDVSSSIPASALKLHPNFELVLDNDAAKLIS